MSPSPKRAFGSTDKSRRKNVNLSLKVAKRMLPLVRGIVRDILDLRQDLKALQPERELLEEGRRDLSWEQRQRRYLIQDEISDKKKALAAAKDELKSLGLSISNEGGPRVEFPTRIHGRQAAFSWATSEEDISHWHYANEDIRRPIPPDWDDTARGRA